MSWCAVAAGVTSSAKTSSAPVIWLVAATASPSTSRKPKPSRRDGNAGGAGDVGVDRGEEERPRGDQHEGDGHDRDDEQDADLPVVMPRKVPKSSESRPLRTPW